MTVLLTGKSAAFTPGIPRCMPIWKSPLSLYLVEVHDSITRVSFWDVALVTALTAIFQALIKPCLIGYRFELDQYFSPLLSN